MVTPHINAKKGDFAKIVLMQGDPLRTKYIANNFLSEVNKITNVRGILGYTGNYKGKIISVMGHGIGIPSCSIYTKELITEYGVKQIIRIGSCGSIQKNIKLRDIIIGMGASTDSKVNRIKFNNHDFAAIADFNLLRNVVETAHNNKIKVHVGNIFSTDLFYNPDYKMFKILEKYGILGIEMEAAGIYSIAAEFGIKALVICTVSDNLKNGKSLSSDERQNTFNDMIKIALESTLLSNSC